MSDYFDHLLTLASTCVLYCVNRNGAFITGTLYRAKCFRHLLLWSEFTRFSLFQLLCEHNPAQPNNTSDDVYGAVIIAQAL